MNFDKPLYLAVLCFIFIFLISLSLISADTAGEVQFETKVLPILQNRCFSCHSGPKTDASGIVTKPKGDVQLDSVKGIEESRHGEVIIPDEPDDSLLYQRITLPEGTTGIMPPPAEGDPLTEQETDLIRKWIEQGANYGKWKGNQSQQNNLSIPKINSHNPPIMPPITSVVFSHDGKTVVACSQAGLHVYEWQTLNLQKVIKVEARNIHDLAFSSKGDRLAVGGGNPATEGIVEIFSWPEGKSLRILKSHRDSVTAVAWRNESSLASASLDKLIILWDLRNGTPIQELKGHSKGISSLCFLNDTDILVSTGIDESVRVWDVNSGELIRSMNNHTHPVHNLAVRPVTEGLPMIASVGDDRTVRFWQPTIGRMVKFARLNIAPLDVEWSKDGSRIVASCADGSIRIIDVDSVEITDTIPALDGWVYALTIHPTDGSIAIGGLNGQVKRIISNTD